MSPRTNSRARVAIATVALLLVLVVMAAYGCVNGRKGPAVELDLAGSIDTRVVYPMTDDYDIISDPEVVDIRFAGGRSYHNDEAVEVWIKRGPTGAPDLLDYVSVRSTFATPDEAYARASQFRRTWGLSSHPTLDGWYEERKLHGPGDYSADKVMGGGQIDEPTRPGFALDISFEIRGYAPLEDRPYQLIEMFSWHDRALYDDPAGRNKRSTPPSTR